MNTLANIKLSQIAQINGRYLKVLNRQGLRTARDFLLYFPFRYEDYSNIKKIEDARIEETATFSGIVSKTKEIHTWKRGMRITQSLLDDGTGVIQLIWFGKAFVESVVKNGVEIRVSGKITQDKKGLVMQNPEFERANRPPTNTARLVPVYSETKGLTSKWIRWQIQVLLKKYADQLENVLPQQMIKELELFPKSEAVKQIHFPEDGKKLEQARKTLAFEDMFLVQLRALEARKNWNEKNALKIPFDEKLVKKFVAGLPFKLTDAQRKATFEILKDLEKDRPMNRLLQGDVGSGKTVVAVIAALQAVNQGFQATIMAPTEILAQQHFIAFSELLKDYNVTIALLTNSYKQICHIEIPKPSRGEQAVWDDKRENIIKNINNGTIQIVVGTQALIQKDVSFKNLALVVVDEQHRFGVSQRAALQRAVQTITDSTPALVPHLLSMTATPIPRTLALAYYGSLDISTLDKMPKGRKKIITKIVDPSGRQKAYEFIKSEIKKGNQAFVIYPLIEESEALKEIKAAEKEYEKLRLEVFQDFKVGLIHGRLKGKEKDRIMRDFKDKKLDILVSTTVIEVGIDIPAASVMVIENAERFGLAQLHQLRGRVGRSADLQSYCLLFTEVDSKKASRRLKALQEIDDGFKLAEIDLKLRGPGQFFGHEQSGLPDFAMKHLGDIKLIKEARTQATRILHYDPTLSKFPKIKNALEKFEKEVHLE